MGKMGEGGRQTKEVGGAEKSNTSCERFKWEERVWNWY